jgi:hypothetical protein
MTGFKSKRKAALDEDGMYLVHQTDHSEDILHMVAQPAQKPNVAAQRPWVGLTPQDLNEIFAVAMTGEHAVNLAADKLKEKNA